MWAPALLLRASGIAENLGIFGIKGTSTARYSASSRAERCKVRSEQVSFTDLVKLNPIVNCHVHKSWPLDPIFTQLNPLHNHMYYLFKPHFISSLQNKLSSLTCHFPSAFTTKILYGVFSS